MSTTTKRRRSRKPTTIAGHKGRTVRHRVRLGDAEPQQPNKGGRPPFNAEEGRMASFGVRLPATMVADLDSRGLIEGKARSELMREALAMLLATPAKPLTRS